MMKKVGAAAAVAVAAAVMVGCSPSNGYLDKINEIDSTLVERHSAEIVEQLGTEVCDGLAKGDTPGYILDALGHMGFDDMEADALSYAAVTELCPQYSDML